MQAWMLCSTCNIRKNDNSLDFPEAPYCVFIYSIVCAMKFNSNILALYTRNMQLCCITCPFVLWNECEKNKENIDKIYWGVSTFNVLHKIFYFIFLKDMHIYAQEAQRER